MSIKIDGKRSKKSQSRVSSDTSAEHRVFGYIRVSSSKQDGKIQKHEILQWADTRKSIIAEWVEEVISSRKKLHERELGSLLDRLQKGDTLIVSEISRLGRSLTEVMTILHSLMQTGVKVYTCKEHFELDDSINSKVLAFAFSLAAEIERQMISSRTREALSHLKSLGRTLGRPKGRLSSNTKLSGKEDQIRELLTKGVRLQAKNAVCDAVIRGELIIQDVTHILHIRKPFLLKYPFCPFCGHLTPRPYMHGHHYQGYDSDKRLAVIFICRDCHATVTAYERSAILEGLPPIAGMAKFIGEKRALPVKVTSIVKTQPEPEYFNVMGGSQPMEIKHAS